MTAASTPPQCKAAPQFPPYMAELIDRAAELLQAYFPGTGPVPFTWWADGEEVAYLARLEWPRSGADGPRVAVLYGRSGQLVCQSLPGQPFNIDPATVCIDYVPSDELANLAHIDAGRAVPAGVPEWFRRFSADYKAAHSVGHAGNWRP